MFDMGFSEIMLIMVILLIVVGPERLPGLARSAGRWIGKARRMVASVKADMEEELRIDELKQTIKQEETLKEFQELSKDVKKLGSEVSSIDSDLDKKMSFGDTAADTAKTNSEKNPDDPVVAMESAADSPGDAPPAPAPDKTHSASARDKDE